MSAKVVPYDERYLADFVSLNREWIEHYFVLEPMDLEQLQKPQALILDPGGEIFFVVENGRAWATCALIPHGSGCYELAKMAVDPKARGKGYGSLMMEAAIEWAKKKGAQKVMLLSNTVLEPAISLYRKHGFQVVHLGSHPDYERCNIEMERVF